MRDDEDRVILRADERQRGSDAVHSMHNYVYVRRHVPQCAAATLHQKRSKHGFQLGRLHKSSTAIVTDAGPSSGAHLHDPVQRLLDDLLALAVQGARGLVQQQDLDAGCSSAVSTTSRQSRPCVIAV